MPDITPYPDGCASTMLRNTYRVRAPVSVDVGPLYERAICPSTRKQNKETVQINFRSEFLALSCFGALLKIDLSAFLKILCPQQIFSFFTVAR